jgi:hypothetical protein
MTIYIADRVVKFSNGSSISNNTAAADITAEI